MQQQKIKFFFLFLIIAGRVHAQNSEIETRINNGELQMSFPSIYFKHNSTDYAKMPYKVDSCFKYIALHFKDNINSLVIWRDSSETEILTNARIKKLKTGLGKYIAPSKINIHSMLGKQKVSSYTISMSKNQEQKEYLLSLNSAFDISKTKFTAKKKSSSHIERPRIFCWSCITSGYHIKERKAIRKAEEQRKEKLN